jgi:hypothetical protein
MNAQRKDRNGDAIPAIVTVFVAVVGMAGILITDIGPGNGSHGGRNAAMITSAALSRAGAIQIPSQPPAGQSAS